MPAARLPSPAHSRHPARPAGAARAATVAVIVAMAPSPVLSQSAEGAEPSFLDTLSSILGSGQPATAESEPAAPEDPGPPSLSTARWLGFTLAIATDSRNADGATLAGAFPEAGSDAWVTDTVSGLTARVRLVWRLVGPDELTQLSAPAAEALGLPPGGVANLAIYVAR